MRAFVIEEIDGDVTYGVRDAEIADDEVVVAIEASGVNFKDALVINPASRVRRARRLIGGVDAAGSVVSSRSPDIAVGTAVAVHGGDLGTGRDGGFAQFVSAPARFISPLPEPLSTIDAMTLGTAGFTAMQSVLALEDHGLVVGSGPVLVTGATGGVGSLAVSILAQRGYEVSASTGSRQSESWLRERGARHVIGRRDIGDQPDRVLGTMTWAGAVDCVGGTTLSEILRTLRYGAAVAASGLVGGADLATTVYPFITRNVSLLGIDAVDAVPSTRERVWRELAHFASSIDLVPLRDRVISLETIPSALEDIRVGATRGRILVDPNR